MRSAQDSVPRRHGHRRPGRAAAWCVAALLALTTLALTPLALVSAPVSAHAELVSSTPRDGADAATLPRTVQLTFSGAVSSTGAFVVVTDPSGAQVAVGKPEVVDGTVTQQTTGGGPAGEYVVAYRVVSADGHPISGELGFTVDAPAAPRQPADPPTPTPAQASGAAGAGASSDAGFVARYATHLGLGALGLVAAVALLGVGVRGRR